MKSSTLKFLLMTLISLMSSLSYGQASKSASNNDFMDKSRRDSSYVAVDLNFISDAVFMGRKDSLSAPYLFPSLTYAHRSGIYLNGSFSYLTRSEESRIDLFLITAGYEFTIKKLEGDISVTKYFFNEDSYNVISQVEADLTANVKYDLDIFNIGLLASTYFSNDSNTDVILVPELSHDLISKNKKFQWSPSIGAYFGSQNFYEQYYINRKLGNGQGQGQGGNNNGQTQNNINIKESEQFKLMAIELSLPTWYIHRSFSFMFSPTLVFPQNESELIIDDVLVKESLEPTFYWMTGLSYRF